jgi:hypothetical protein
MPTTLISSGAAATNLTKACNRSEIRPPGTPAFPPERRLADGADIRARSPHRNFPLRRESPKKGLDWSSDWPRLAVRLRSQVVPIADKKHIGAPHMQRFSRANPAEAVRIHAGV